MHLDSHNPFILGAMVGVLSAARRSHASVGKGTAAIARSRGGLLPAEGAEQPGRASIAGSTGPTQSLCPTEDHEAETFEAAHRPAARLSPPSPAPFTLPLTRAPTPASAAGSAPPCLYRRCSG